MPTVLYKLLTQSVVAGNKKNIEIELAKEVKELTKEVKKLKNQDFMHVFSHPVKMMGYSFMKGLMVGFGSVLGATIIVAVFIYILAQISLIPIVGEFVEGVIQEVQSVSGEQLQNSGEAIKGGAIMNKYNEAKDTIKETEAGILNGF